MPKTIPLIILIMLITDPIDHAHAAALAGQGKLQTFQRENEGLHFAYGNTPDAGRIIREEDGQRYFAFEYGDTRNVAAPPHAGYTVNTGTVWARVGSQLRFRYRTDHIRDLRLGLDLVNQRLSWNLTLEPSAEWTTLTLPLAERYVEDMKMSRTVDLALITFAPVNPGVESSYLHLDDFELVETEVDLTAEALEARVKDDQAKLTALRRALRLTGLQMTQDTYAPGEPIEIDYNLTNTAVTDLGVPVNRQYSRDMYLVGAVQSYIVSLDTSDPPRPAGGTIVPIDEDRVLPGQKIPLSGRYTKDLPAGRYEWLIYYKLPDHHSVYDSQRVEFAVAAEEE